jgi:hypothetical protein
LPSIARAAGPEATTAFVDQLSELFLGDLDVLLSKSFQGLVTKTVDPAKYRDEILDRLCAALFPDADSLMTIPQLPWTSNVLGALEMYLDVFDFGEERPTFLVDTCQRMIVVSGDFARKPAARFFSALLEKFLQNVDLLGTVFGPVLDAVASSNSFGTMIAIVECLRTCVLCPVFTDQQAERSASRFPRFSIS